MSRETGFRPQRPPYRGLLAPHADHRLVVAGSIAFGDGTADMYDSHPLHVLLLAQLVELAQNRGLALPDPTTHANTPETRLDELLVRSLIAVVETDEPSNESVVVELGRMRHGPALAAWVRGAASAVELVERPWLLQQIPLPERVDHPVAELELAVWELVDAATTDAAKELAPANLHVGAISDLAATVALAKRLRRWPGVLQEITSFIANDAVRAVWRGYRGPVLYFLERLVSGATLDPEKLRLVAALMTDEAYLKFMPGGRSNGSFTLAETFIEQTHDVQAKLQQLWRSASPDDELLNLRDRHLRLLGRVES